MAYVKYTGLTSPDQVLAKIAEYVVSRGYNVVQDITDDLNIYDMSSVDGKKFVFMDRTNTYFIHLRTMNSINIFGTTDDAAMDVKTPDTDYRYSGIGMTISEGYSPTQRWYNQFQVPIKLNTKEVQFVYIPINRRDGSGPDVKINEPYTLYCNNITSPSDTLVFSVVGEKYVGNQFEGHGYGAVHLVIGNIDKYGDWEGGVFFSGSSVPSLAKSAYNFFDFEVGEDGQHPIESGSTLEYMDDSGILPVLSSGTISNTFLRIDIDDAVKESRGNIRWASSGTDNVTGKPMSLPVRVQGGGNGLIPHYYVMQSTSRLDWGRNINTLNCVTLNMPIFMSVRVDPDVLQNYAIAGQVSGVYFVCMLNMQTGFVYEMNYPQSNDTCQVFSYSMRRGKYGFDGLSVKQIEANT